MGLFGPKRHAKYAGEYSEVVTAERLLKAGYTVLTPHEDSLRYDFVIEDADRQFWRVLGSVKQVGLKGICLRTFNADGRQVSKGSK